MQHVVHAHRLEQEHDVGEVRALDLGHGILVHLVLERPLGKQPEALARAYATGAPRALIRRRTRTRHDGQRGHARAWIVRVLLHKAGVNHERDAVDRDASLGNVRREHDLARTGRRRLEDARLQVARQVRVDRTHDQLGHAAAERARRRLQIVHRHIDLVLSGKEDEDIALRLCRVDLEHGRDRRVQVVGLGLRRVVNVHREAAARHVKDRRVVEERAELVRIERRARDD